jgi:hypothetical protein
MILNVPHYKFFFYFEILIKKKTFIYIYFFKSQQKVIQTLNRDLLVTLKIKEST